MRVATANRSFGTTVSITTHHSPSGYREPPGCLQVDHLKVSPMLLISFLKDQRSSITPMRALAIIPVIGLMSAAADCTLANSIKATLQSALGGGYEMLQASRER
jgi:hypothetical protein